MPLPFCGLRPAEIDAPALSVSANLDYAGRRSIDGSSCTKGVESLQ